MSNGIKYSVSQQTNSLKKGNFWIATGDVDKGPTSSTDYWSAITPPLSGYTIYLNKSSNGPSIYVAQNDTNLINLTNLIGSQSFTTVGDSLNWYNTQTDKMVFNIDYPAILTSGVTFISDVGTTLSYPLNSIRAYTFDPTTNGGYMEYANGAYYVSEYGGGFLLDGIDDAGYCTATSSGYGIFLTAAFTWVVICRGNNSSNTWSNTSISNNRYPDGAGFSFATSNGTRPVAFYVGSTTNAFAVNIGSITPANVNIPHMYVVSSNGTNLHKGYVDNGAPVTSTTSISRADVQHEVFVGVNGYVSGSNMKMVSYVNIMYNRQLSDAEVLALYNSYQGRFGF
jgi:hypothetical protein